MQAGASDGSTLLCSPVAVLRVFSTTMAATVFPYPGGKTYLAPWVIEHFPEHDCYAEVFGGGASILVNKEPSRVEVFNDLDGDIVQFFEVLREREGELREWLRKVPYAKDVHDEWATAFYDGRRPDDPIERAGRFFFLRHSQFAAAYDSHSGFSSARQTSKAPRFQRSISDLSEFTDRLRHVQIENRDFETFLERFDGEETFFYCDPPYVEEGDVLYSHEGGFDHRRFVECLHDLEAKWCVSYTDLPPGLDDYRVVERDAKQHMCKGRSMTKSSRTERLVMNYDINENAVHSRYGQSGLSDYC